MTRTNINKLKQPRNSTTLTTQTEAKPTIKNNGI